MELAIIIVIATASLALAAGSGLLRLGRKEPAWRVGDVLATAAPGKAIYTVMAVDTRHKAYLLALGAWPRLGAQRGISFAELAALHPVFVRHVDIG